MAVQHRIPEYERWARSYRDITEIEGTDPSTPAGQVFVSTKGINSQQRLLVVHYATHIIPFSAGLIPRVKVYKNKIADSNFIDGALDARIWASTQRFIILEAGEFITFNFINLNPADRCTATVQAYWIDQ